MSKDATVESVNEKPNNGHRREHVKQRGYDC